MTEFIEPRALGPVTTYSKGLVDGVISLLKTLCFEGKAPTDSELDDAIRLFVLESAYGTGVDIDINEVVDSIYAEVDEFMIKWNSNKEE